MSPFTAAGSGMVIFRRDERRGLLRASGEVDLSNIDYFASVLHTEARRTNSVTLDVSRLGFLGLDGCHAIRRIARDLHRRGGTLRLLDAKPLIKRMFQLVGSDGNPGLEVLDTHPEPHPRSAGDSRLPSRSTRRRAPARTLRGELETAAGRTGSAEPAVGFEPTT